MSGCWNNWFLPWLILLMRYVFYTLSSSVVKYDGARQVARGVQKCVMSIVPTRLSTRMSVVLCYAEEARFTGMSLSSFTLVLFYIILFLYMFVPPF